MLHYPRVVSLNGCNRHVAFPQMVSVLTSTNDMLHYPHVVSVLTGTTDMLHCPQVVSIFPAWLSVCRVRPRTAGRVRGQTDEEVGWPDPGAGKTEERWRTHKKGYAAVAQRITRGFVGACPSVVMTLIQKNNIDDDDDDGDFYSTSPAAITVSFATATQTVTPPPPPPPPPPTTTS